MKFVLEIDLSSVQRTGPTGKPCYSGIGLHEILKNVSDNIMHTYNNVDAQCRAEIALGLPPVVCGSWKVE